MKRILFLLFALQFALPSVRSASPSRYISLAPATTEILFALGLEEEVVAVSSSCDYPPEVLEKPTIGSFSQPNMEMILALRPDYVFCTGLEQSQVIAQLRSLGLPVYVSDPQTLDALYESIGEMGAITQRTKEAGLLVGSIRDTIAAVERDVAARSAERRPRVFVEIWSDPLTAAGKGSFIDEVIRAAGGENIAFDTRRPYSVISPELVIERDPDCIIFAYMDSALPRELVARRSGWGSISAVEKGALYNDIDPNILLRPGPRIGMAAEEIHKRLYKR